MQIILKNAKYLAECPHKLMASISIVKDLTRHQSEEEADLLEEVKRKEQ